MPKDRARRWRSIVYGPAGDGAAQRRGSDGVRVVVAVLAVLCCWLVAMANSHPEQVLVGVLTPPPDGVRWLVTTIAWVGSLGVVIVLAAFSLFSRRRAMARDIVLAGLGAWLAALVIVALVGPNPGGASSAALHGVDPGFPVAGIAAAVAVATAALPFLSRNLRRLLEVVVTLAVIASVVHGSGLPVSVLASVALGWGVTAVVHLAFGSPLGFPSPAEVVELLSDLGVVTSDVAPARHQVWGVARFHGSAVTAGKEKGATEGATTGATPGAPGRIDVAVYGRDAHDAQLLAKLFRFVVYRDSGPTLSLTRAQQVEHEAYVTLLSERAGARVPEVLVAGSAGPAHDAVLVTRPPAGTLLRDLPEGQRLSDATLEDLLRQVATLRSVGIAHGAINPSTVAVASDGSAGLVDFRVSSVGVPGERLDRDLAATLATLALAAGAERTIAAARVALPEGALAAALPFLQRAALDPVVSHELRSRKSLLAELRQRGAGAASVDVPKLAEPRRISWVNLVVVAGSIIGGWALIGVLVNVTKSWSTITGARWGWVTAVFILAQLAYPAVALTTVGSVTDPLPYGRTVALEVANTFVSLAAGTAGTLAGRVRFFQQEGYEATLAVSSAVVASTASWIVKGLLFLIALPFAIGGMHLTTAPSSGSHAKLVWLIVLIVVGAGVLLGVIFAVPRYRRLAADKLRPKATEVWSHLKVLAAHPKNLIEIFGGGVVAQLLIALALGAALHAVGQHLSLATLLVVLTLASMLGGVSPVPGGMGVVEAGMILGLTAAGVPQNEAVAATFIQRLFTAYLPPIWGWFVLIWMRKKEYL